MKRIVLAVILLLMPNVAFAQTATETLVLPPYPAQTPWKQIKDQHNSFLRDIEWIPADQKEDDIRDILVQQNVNMKLMPASLMMAGIFQGLARQCKGLRVNGPIPQIENGHTVAYGQAYCVGQTATNKDIDTFLKIVNGNDALYIIQREFRRPAEPGAQPGIRHFPGDKPELAKANLEAQNAANAYLGQVRLCPVGQNDCPVVTAPKP